jgi:hypothetical protein
MKYPLFLFFCLPIFIPGYQPSTIENSDTDDKKQVYFLSESHSTAYGNHLCLHRVFSVGFIKCQHSGIGKARQLVEI